MIEAITKESIATIKKTDDALVDAVVLSAATESEHYEIAVYETLVTYGEARGAAEVVALLRQNLDRRSMRWTSRAPRSRRSPSRASLSAQQPNSGPGARFQKRTPPRCTSRFHRVRLPRALERFSSCFRAVTCLMPALATHLVAVALGCDGRFVSARSPPRRAVIPWPTPVYDGRASL